MVRIYRDDHLKTHLLCVMSFKKKVLLIKTSKVSTVLVTLINQFRTLIKDKRHIKNGLLSQLKLSCAKLQTVVTSKKRLESEADIPTQITMMKANHQKKTLTWAIVRSVSCSKRPILQPAYFLQSAPRTKTPKNENSTPKTLVNLLQKSWTLLKISAPTNQIVRAANIIQLIVSLVINKSRRKLYLLWQIRTQKPRWLATYRDWTPAITTSYPACTPKSTSLISNLILKNMIRMV